MFGFGKKEKEYDVRLTENQIKDMTSKMSKMELKEFNQRQKQAEADRDWDEMMMMDMFLDD